MPVGLPDASPVGFFVVGDGELCDGTAEELVIVGDAGRLPVGLSVTIADGFVDDGDANEADGTFVV